MLYLLDDTVGSSSTLPTGKTSSTRYRRSASTYTYNWLDCSDLVITIVIVGTVFTLVFDNLTCRDSDTDTDWVLGSRGSESQVFF